MSPNQSLTRGMLVTMLYRYAGSPAVTGQTHFTDVGEDRYYSQAVAWAEEVQVANGYPDGTFRPNQDISREQLVTMLFRYVRSQEADNGLRDSLSDFDDGDKISKFARESMQWAVANQVINGVTATTLAPKAQATRAQTATVLYRTLASL
ncbi:MAG: S-layer homology domain-containing protein [Oscillospiraceae bacterium]